MSTGDSEFSSKLVSLDDIKEAHQRVIPHIHRTPLLTNTTLDGYATERIQRKASKDIGPIKIRLAFKSEHLQVVGAFKIRGATNAVATHLKRLQQEHAGKGSFDVSKLCVITHSSGNHAAAVACAAEVVGARAAVVMPRTAPQIKKSAVAGYGARIVESEPTQAARESTCQALKEELENDGSGTVVRFIHPYDEELVIAGQGTMGLEIVEQASLMQEGRRSCSAASASVRMDDAKAWSSRSSQEEPPLDFVVAPVGGGGMLSGVSTAIKGLDGRITVFGAEPVEAGDAARSIESGKLQPAITPPRTICDGLLTALSPRTMKHIQENVESIMTVSEQSILSSLRLVWERMKQIIEPSAAVGLAVVLDKAKTKRTRSRSAS
jgi:threonine dehydratase